MLYEALPPEINTARLLAGAGTEPMYQAAAGWEALAISLELQAEELAGSLAALHGAWQGLGGERAVQSTTALVNWLRTTAIQAQKRAMQAIAQASAYTAAVAATPPLPEIEMNHVTHATLEATNFLGVNAAPIGANESDYFVRMWNQAADAMSGYQAETTLNTVFEPISPVPPIVMPGVGESAAASAVAHDAALVPGSMMRETAFAHVTAEGQLQSAALASGNAVSQGGMAAQRVEGRAQNEDQASSRQNQVMEQGTQMLSQVASMLGQLPQQLMQPVQQLSQPLQQVTQIFSQMGSTFGSDKAQVGLVDASPLSNHPLAGGTGPCVGAGLVHAASLPGLGGTPLGIPVMSSLVGVPTEPAPAAPGASAGAAGSGSVPIGGGGPMGTAGDKGRSGGCRDRLNAPSPLPLEEEDDDDW